MTAKRHARKFSGQEVRDGQYKITASRTSLLVYVTMLIIAVVMVLTLMEGKAIQIRNST